MTITIYKKKLNTEVEKKQFLNLLCLPQITGRAEEASVLTLSKTLRSPRSTKFWRHSVLSDRIKYSRPRFPSVRERGYINIYISSMEFNFSILTLLIRAGLQK